MKSSSSSAFQRRLEQKNPYLFIEYWKEGERPFNWFAEWRFLSVEISDIDVSISHQCVEKRFGDDAPPLPLRKLNEDVVPDNIPAHQKRDFFGFVSRLFNESFKKPDKVASVGW
jgi:hypothetical protein